MITITTKDDDVDLLKQQNALVCFDKLLPPIMQERPVNTQKLPVLCLYYFITIKLGKGFKKSLTVCWYVSFCWYLSPN